jgi:hypothetical protein
MNTIVTEDRVESLRSAAKKLPGTSDGSFRLRWPPGIVAVQLEKHKRSWGDVTVLSRQV